MDTNKIVRELHEEKRRLSLVIARLEAVEEALCGPPQENPAKTNRGRKSMSPEERHEVSERMRRYWASRRKQRRANSGSAGD
jgi:DNA-binding NarL/FixJ family response regulator